MVEKQYQCCWSHPLVTRKDELNSGPDLTTASKLEPTYEKYFKRTEMEINSEIDN